MIEKLTVRGFKGLRGFSIEPRRMNLLIGANGTGKTNFADLIAFMAGVCRRGLSETIADFGGLSQVRTRSKRNPYKLSIELTLGEDPSRSIKQATYSFTLTQAGELKVQTEKLEAIIYERTSVNKSDNTASVFEQPVELSYYREGTSIKDWSHSLGSRVPEFINEQGLVLASPFFRSIAVLNNYISSWKVYNIDAMLSKQLPQIGDDRELRRDGANIIAFVARMLRKPGLRSLILKDLQEVVPYIQDIQPARLLTIQTLQFIEKDTGDTFQIPDMSDGTIRLLGILAVLRQSSPPAVIVMEEPENALHAYAIHYILRVMRSVTMRERSAAQIFLTSHSPTVVDEVLSLEAMRETNNETACFITQRKPGEPSIVPAPEAVMQAIARNLGRPSDFQREGSFGDDPVQPALSGVDK